MKRNVHAIAGVLAFCFIAVFWTSTMVAELFFDHAAVASVKLAISYALIAFVPCMAIVGATGFAMGGKSTFPTLVAKRRRMPIIGANGLLILIPAAIFLCSKAQSGEFDRSFYTVQLLELLAGAVNLFLMAQNIRAGRQMSRRHRRS
ncbi:hypothetical protein DFR38_1022 [Aquitalea magnusonii]|uniref:Transmembrane protein n=2 Tax=Aquitalea magnusonii TaxID=332411 RepID=A0A318JP10_9NEIS|nr:hypothetical protein DFR38_1022 [Aquitalea magnusonii]